jgi:hypothetical protein
MYIPYDTKYYASVVKHCFRGTVSTGLYGDKKLQYAYCTKTFPYAQVQIVISVQTLQQATTPTPGK